MVHDSDTRCGHSSRAASISQTEPIYWLEINLPTKLLPQAGQLMQRTEVIAEDRIKYEFKYEENQNPEILMNKGLQWSGR
jgi:hypothetical protein